jgi:secreted trypsin-like serine protease
LKVIPGSECAPPAAATRRKRQAVAPEGIICTLNENDKNACAGDEGSPVFVNQSGALQFVGVISHFLEQRPNARCQDGHKVVITQLGAWQTFLKDPTVVPEPAATK